MSSTADHSGSATIHEGDTVTFFCPEAKGFVFSQPPNSSYSHVTVFPVANPERVAQLKDPVFPSVHFASFQVLAENANLNQKKTLSPLDVPRRNNNNFLRRSLVYGRKIKLLHVASKMFLSLESINDSGSLNKAATLVDTFDKDTCLFRILPSRPTKNRGEDVLPQDQIKLESVSEKGHHILCALNTLTGKYELKMAVTDSLFVISSQSKARAKVPHKALRGCDVVMLFNFKREAYLAGRGSIVTQVLPEDIKEDIITEVGARKRESVHGIQKAPPISGDCFWQLERADAPLNGDQFKYGDQCRIKHLPTQEYLAVIQKGQKHHMTLKKLEAGMPLDTETTFSLVSVVGQTGGVLKGSYVELRHIQSAKNLSVLSKGFLQRTFSSESSLEAVSQSKWFKLGLEDSDQSKQQCFRVEEVNSDLIHEYYHVSGVTAVLKDYMYKFTADPKPVPFPPALDEPQEVLTRLAEWINDEHSHKSRANMLRVSQGVDLLVGFLHEIDTLHDYKELRKLCEKVSLVLQSYVESSNKKSHLYLAEKRFMDVMFRKIGIGIGIEKVLSTLVKDESGITEKVVTRLTESSNFTQRILKNLDSSILNFLSTLCFTAGKPARNLQNIIREKVIADGEDSFIRTEVIDGVICFASPEQIKGPISQICSRRNLDGANKKMFEFFVAQLKLFSRICKGVNLVSIRMICEEKKFITFQEALICINDPDLHPLLQSAYLDFVTSAYVDLNVEESGTDIDNIWHSYFWDEICPNPMEAAGLGDTFEAIPNQTEIRALQTSIRLFLSQNKVLYSKEEVEGHNELLVQMLAVMEPLVSYGFYWKDEEINEITKFLIDIIDGNHDRPKPNASPFHLVRYQQKKRYKSNERNQKVFRVKTRAVRILHLLFKMLVYTTLGKLTFDFKFLKSDMEVASQDNYSPVNSSLVALFEEDYQLNHQDPEIVEVARRRLRKLFAEPAYKSFDMNESEGQGLIKILLDLLKYQDDELRLSSILLLFDIFQEENILFHDASISYIVTPPSAEVYWDMVVNGSFSDESKCLLRLVQGTAVENSDDDDTLNEEVVGILEIVRDVCAIDEDETQPHACNQGIAFSTGVFSALLAYVLQFCSTNHEDQIPLLKLTCSALQAIARKNPQVQKKIFASFMDFLDVKIAVAPVARLLTVTLTDNPLLCRNLSESDIKHLLSVAATATTADYYDFFTTLEAVMKPYKSCKVIPLLLKNYQEVIARTFTEQRHEYFNQIFYNSDGNETRVKILKEADSDDDRLLKLLAVSDLLATTSEGQCKYAEDVCQTTFGLEDLVGIISNPDIELDRKKPFARLLNWSYLNTERDSLVSIAALSKNSSFWAHLEECSLIMDSFCDKLSQDGVNNEKIKVEIRVLFSQHISFTAWRERSEGGEEEEEEEEDQIVLECGDKNIPLYSFLVYLIDGLIPLVTSFCAQLAAHTSSGLTSKMYSSLLTPSIVAVLKTLSDSIVKLLKNYPEVLLTTPQQVNHWTKCMDVLVFMLPPEQTEELNEAREAAHSSEEYFTSPAMREYENELEEERIMNIEFQNFVTNFKITYEGRNPVDNSQENILHDDEDDLVPAGTSFRELVKLFTDEITADNKCTLTKTDSLLQLMDILYRQLQQPLTSKERANFDYVLLTSLQVLSGVVHTKIDSIDPQLQSNDPESFQQEYDNKVKPLQDTLVELKSHEKVMIHLAHPKDEIAVQVLAFLRVLLYLGNENAQKKIGNLTSHRDTKFFLRLNKLLESVVASIGQPLSRTLKFDRQLSSASQTIFSPPPPPPTSSEATAPPTEQVDTEQVTTETKEGEDGGAATKLNPQTSLKQLAAEIEETGGPRGRTMSMSSDEDEPWDDGEEETDFGGGFDIGKKTVLAYTMEGAGQLETSEADAKKRASVVLDVVAWICDGQNKDMQNILRKQDTALTNVNIVGAVAVLLQTLAEHFSEKTSRTTQKAIQALIEVCAGNFTNQEVAFKGQIVDSINIILRFSNFLHSSDDKTELLKVKASAIELLEVMIEETNENSKALAEGISQDLSVEDLMDTLLEFWELCNDSSLQLKTEAKRAMFRGYHVLKRIADYMGKSVNQYVEYEEYEWDDDVVSMWQHLNDSSRSIEVNYVTQNQEEILTRVYFPFDPSRDLTEDEKEVVKSNIKRDSPEDKVKDLLEWMESVRNNVQHKAKIRTKLYLRWAVLGSTIRHLTLMFLTLLLNLFVIVLFDVPESFNTASNYTIIIDPVVPGWYVNYLLYILGAFHLILALWMVSEYFVREFPNLLFGLPLVTQIIYDIKKWSDHYEILRRFRSAINEIFCGGKITDIKKPAASQCFEVYFFSFAPLYRILFVLFSIAALGTRGYFYCGCILYVFLKNDVLHQVLTAVRRSAAQLISVALLGLGVLLIFAVISFVFLHNFFDNSNHFCRSMVECYVSVIREGLLDTLGTMIPVQYDENNPSFTVYWARAIFDVIFFVVVTTLGLNIVVAILVDRFSELRSERDEIKKDKLNYCFVCGIDNDTFERKAKGFRHHVFSDHNMWNYIYFLLHLDSMYTNDHNALEKYVNDNIQGRKIGFFPLRKAKVLGGRVANSAVQPS